MPWRWGISLLVGEDLGIWDVACAAPRWRFPGRDLCSEGAPSGGTQPLLCCPDGILPEAQKPSAGPSMAATLAAAQGLLPSRTSSQWGQPVASLPPATDAAVSSGERLAPRRAGVAYIREIRAELKANHVRTI
jgi:hypothetical protein